MLVSRVYIREVEQVTDKESRERGHDEEELRCRLSAEYFSGAAAMIGSTEKPYVGGSVLLLFCSKNITGRKGCLK